LNIFCIQKKNVFITIVDGTFNNCVGSTGTDAEATQKNKRRKRKKKLLVFVNFLCALYFFLHSVYKLLSAHLQKWDYKFTRLMSCLYFQHVCCSKSFELRNKDILKRLFCMIPPVINTYQLVSAVVVQT